MNQCSHGGGMSGHAGMHDRKVVQTWSWCQLSEVRVQQVLQEGHDVAQAAPQQAGL